MEISREDWGRQGLVELGVWSHGKRGCWGFDDRHGSRSDSTSTGAAREGPPRRDVRMPDRTRFFLDQEALATQMQTIFTRLDHTVRDELRTQKVDPERPAGISHSPSPDLRAAYETVFGASGHGRQTSDLAADDFCTEDMAIAVASAQLHRLVFDGQGVEAMLFQNRRSAVQEGFGSLLQPTDDHLRRYAMDLDTVLRCGYQAWIQQPQIHELMQVSNSAIVSIIRALQEHLHAAAGAPSPDAGVRDRWWTGVEKLVHDALRLRCEVSCAREQYKFIWPQRWELYDCRAMATRDPHGGKVVLATVFPGLMVERGDGVESVFKAMVRTM